MKFFPAAALLAAVASAANAVIINTPDNVIQCQPVLITWDPQGSQGPFFLSAHPGDNSAAPALLSWDGLTGTSLTWIVAVPAGQSLVLLLRDSTGQTSLTAPFQVISGSTTGCLSSSSFSFPVGSSLTSTTSTSVRLPSTTPSSASTPAGSAGVGTGGALTNAVNFGSVGLLAALVGAFLV